MPLPRAYKMILYSSLVDERRQRWKSFTLSPESEIDPHSAKSSSNRIETIESPEEGQLLQAEDFPRAKTLRPSEDKQHNNLRKALLIGSHGSKAHAKRSVAFTVIGGSKTSALIRKEQCHKFQQRRINFGGRKVISLSGGFRGLQRGPGPRSTACQSPPVTP